MRFVSDVRITTQDSYFALDVARIRPWKGKPPRRRDVAFIKFSAIATSAIPAVAELLLQTRPLLIQCGLDFIYLRNSQLQKYARGHHAVAREMTV